MKYEIRPIEKDRWHGYVGGEQDFARGISFNALIDSSTGRYAIILTQDRIDKLQEITGYDLDTRQKAQDAPHPFYDSAVSKIRLPHYPVFFDTQNPNHEILIGIVKSVPMVANSLQEYEDGLWPEASHYIYSEDEQTAAKEVKIAQLDEARALKVAMDKDQKVAIVRILSGRDVSGKTDKFVNVAAEEVLVEAPEAFLRYANMQKEDMDAHYLIHRCVDKGILQKEGPSVFYGTDRLGYSFQESVDFIIDPKNQPIRIRLMEMVS